MAFNLDAMSIYGQDTRILDSINYPPTQSSSTNSYTTHNPSISEKPPSRCLLLLLPAELRQKIYSYILPRTIETKSKGITWLRGNTAILATSRQIFKEATQQLYGTNTFVIDVVYDCSTFNFQWLLPNGLVPNRRMAFPDHIVPRNLSLIHRLHIRIKHIDSYTGMIKYNYSGPGLTDGLKDQVTFLCIALRKIEEINHLHIHLQDEARKPELSQRVLDPFFDVKNVHHATISGDLQPEFAKKLVSCLVKASTKLDFFAFPPEIRKMIYDRVFDQDAQRDLEYRKRKQGSRHSSPRPKGVTQYTEANSLLSLAFSSKSFYSEIISYFYRKLHFKLIIQPAGTYIFGPTSFADSRARKALNHPWIGHTPSSYPAGICVAAMSSLRKFSISIGLLPKDLPIARKTALETLFTRLAEHLSSAASLKYVRIDYVAPPRSSSAEAAITPPSSNPNTPPITTANMTESTSILQTQTTISPIATTTRSNSWGLSEATVEPQAYTSSPTELAQSRETYARGAIVMQSRTEQLLIAKLNPLFAKVKQREGYIDFASRDIRAAGGTWYEFYSGSARHRDEIWSEITGQRVTSSPVEQSTAGVSVGARRDPDSISVSSSSPNHMVISTTTTSAARRSGSGSSTQSAHSPHSPHSPSNNNNNNNSGGGGRGSSALGRIQIPTGDSPRVISIQDPQSGRVTTVMPLRDRPRARRRAGDVLFPNVML
jgi:hypothetical protein